MVALARRLDRFDDDLLGQVHHDFVIGVSPIQFDHGELRIVLWADSFIPVDSAYLIDALDAADHEPLEVQFQRDPQDKLHVQGVVVGLERFGGRAAGDGMKGWTLDLHKLMLGKRFADRLNDFRSFQKRLERLWVVGQIDIAHSLTQLWVLQASMLLRWWLERLGHVVQLRCENGQLTGVGPS